MIYELLEDLTAWPRVFPPVVHVEYLARDSRQERARIWLHGGDRVTPWVALRQLDPDALHVTYRQEAAQHPVADMGGGWIVEPRSEDESFVRLQHDYRPVQDDAETRRWIDEVLERNSAAELAALTAGAELAAHSPESLLILEDSVHINGGAQEVYDFLYRAENWSEHFDHVLGASVRQAGEDVHFLELSLPDKDGNPHTTRQIRVAFPLRKIAYKQLVIPPMAKAHVGEWMINETDTGVTATARQTVVINEPGIARVLGEGTTLGQARTWIHNALGRNGRLILEGAKNYVETRR